MTLLRRKKLADSADPHDLYQRSVQDPEAEIDFVLGTWDELRDRPAGLLREDFCGTAATACEWVRRDVDHYAIAVDIDPEVLDWGMRHNIAALKPEQQQRIDLLQGDVLEVQLGPVDIVLAMNFSYWLFRTRGELRAYFRAVRAGLTGDGLFILDAYGGYDAPRELEECRECEGFTYIWDQTRFNPVDSRIVCHIHFAFPDGSRIDRAFSYDWRLWTLPELHEVLLEAGFRHVDVYWEGTDEDTGEGDGVYVRAEVGDADAGWISYLVAQA